MKVKLTPRQLYLICGVTILVVVLNWFLEIDFAIINTLLSIVGFALNAFWILFLVNDSQYGKTIFGRLTYFLLAIIIVGFLFKLQHWPLAGTTLIIGYAGIMIIYTIRFLTKKNKLFVDILKLLWVETTAVISLLILLHKINKEYLLINGLIFIALICTFTIYYNKRMSLKRY